MEEKQLPTCSSGFSFFAILLTFSFFLAISASASNTGTNTTSSSSKPLPSRGNIAIPLTSQLHSAEERQQGIKNVQQTGEEKVKCKTEQGSYVDWFIAYKLPKNRTSSNVLVRAGLAYAYILPPQTLRHPTPTTTTVNISVNENASGNKGSFSGGHDNLNTYFPVAKDSNSFTTENVSKSAATAAAAAAATWTLSAIGIDSPGSMVGQTLEKLFVKDNQDIAYLTYNDQPPVGPTANSGGHSKGIIVTSLASGIWIQHSVPHFPLIDPNNYHYQYPATGKNNGQVFHCMSFSSTKDVDDLARIFEITKPHVVNFSFPTNSFKNALPQLMSIAHPLEYQIENNQFASNHLSTLNRSVDQPEPLPITKDEQALAEASSSSSPCLNEIDEKACLNGKLIGNKMPEFDENKEATVEIPLGKQNWDLIELHTAGGRTLKAFVKGPSFNEDIYSSWVAPTYKTKLEVQSWLNGPHPFPSNCSLVQYSVYNILHKNIAGHAFSTHNDHSKWAMSLTGDEQSVVCISDLNRMEHQLKRGGVTLCFTDATVWTAFNSSIIDVQPCPRLSSGGSCSGNGIVATTPINNVSSLSPLSEPGSVVPSSNEVVKAVFKNYGNQTGAQSGGGIMMSSVSRDQQQRQRHLFQRRKLQRKVKSRTYSLMAI